MITIPEMEKLPDNCHECLLSFSCLYLGLYIAVYAYCRYIYPQRYTIRKQRESMWYEYIKRVNPLRADHIERIKNTENIEYINEVIRGLFSEKLSAELGPPVLTYCEKKAIRPYKFDTQRAIETREGVCRHYTFILYIVLKHFNVGCCCVFNRDHAWNGIVIKEKYFEVDATNFPDGLDCSVSEIANFDAFKALYKKGKLAKPATLLVQSQLKNYESSTLRFAKPLLLFLSLFMFLANMGLEVK